MRDMLIITPSRARPLFVSRLCNQIAQTSAALTDICFAFDDDDPAFDANMTAALDNELDGARVKVVSGPRRQLGPWTNIIARAAMGKYLTYASLGDDHEPRTPGWDARLIEAIAETGGGFACPNGVHRPEYPEAVAVSCSVVEALGWMCEPSLSHYCVDQVWLELAQGADCWSYLPDVIVEHTGHGLDNTERGNQAHVNGDMDAWKTWQQERKYDDIATVRAALAESTSE